jgi:polyhydroxybutyrate depolymerase
VRQTPRRPWGTKHLPGGGYAGCVPLRHARPGPQSRSVSVAVHAALLCCVVLLVACAPRVASASHADRPTSRPSPACSTPAAPTTSGRLLVGEQERSVLARVPQGTSAAPRDLVIAFHGRTNDAGQVRRYFDLDTALPEAIIVYPRALPAGPGAFGWSVPGDPPEGLRDFALVRAIIDAFGADHCIDLERVFVVGHSLGASFANDVACHLGDRIRAVASVAGGLQGGPCVGRTAAMILHHPDDRLVPLTEGELARDVFRTINGLADVPADPVEHTALARLRCHRYGGADVAHPVVWCPHDDAAGPGGRYYPHTWPDGAARAIAVFFASLP